MKYALYPGCALHGTSREYGASIKAVCRAMEFDLMEMPGWTCCGATSAHMTSDLLAVALPAANLARAERLDRDVLLPCAACYNRLAVARERLVADEALRVRVVEAIGEEVTGSSRTVHPLTAFTLDEVRTKVQRQLRQVRGVAYYGCLLTRPVSVSVDPNPVNPMIMDDLMRACGVEMLDWPLKTECCGATHSLTKPKTANRLMARLLESAVDAGANCIIVACPLCQSNLDLHQERIEHAAGRLLNIPIVFFTEILALALGVSPRKLELGRHIVSAVGLAQA